MKITKITPIILLSLLIFPGSVYSQLVLEKDNNRPRENDALTKQEVKFKDAGRSGKDVLWDFSSFEYVSKKRYVLTKPIDQIGAGELASKYAVEVDDSRTAVSYEKGSSGYIDGNEQGTIQRYNLSGDSLLVWGYEFPSTRVEYDIPEVCLTFPFRFKDKLSNYYSGEGVFYDRLGINVMGSVQVEADAYGMMILPNKDTLDNVLRVTTLKTTLDDREPLFLKKNGKEAKVKGDSIAKALKLNKDCLKTEVVRWYAEGYRYPVFETVRNYTDKQGKKSNENLRAFFYSPVEQEEEYLKNDETNSSILAQTKRKKKEKETKNKLKSPQATDFDNTIAVERYNIYPNPTSGDVQAEVYLEQEGTLQFSLHSMQGKVVYRSPEEIRSGVCRQTIPTASLPKGTYVLNITTGQGKVISEKIIKL